ncbi:baseplate J/gp47 family protein [Polaromonas sp.]|uniref:baseplate assembly protein n=1 Tax=Polaromonas sp. TaxID=1869339 RepID=UPI00375292ED
MSLLDRLLPEPDFVVRDPQGVTQQMVSQYEALTGKTLYPAQVERILVDVIAYRESLMREAVQDAAKLNLVRYSRAPILDYLGENIGVGRLDAVKARTTLRFTFNPAPVSATLLPQGTVVEGGEISFECLAQNTVPPGALSIDVEAACTQAGVNGNGFVPGQIKTLSSSLPGLSVDTVQNITTSAGGAEEEDDEHLKERIVLAPEQFSNAGSVGAYRFYALSAHQDIIDVAVVSPTPGVVNLHPLVKTGLPSAAVKAAVLAACNADRVRPLTDQVNVLDPVIVDYAITAQLTLFSTADAALAQSEAEKAAVAYRDRQQARLGQDIVRTQIIEVLHSYGVYSVALPQPAADQVLSDHSWPRCTAITITVAGTAQG